MAAELEKLREQLAAAEEEQRKLRQETSTLRHRLQRLRQENDGEAGCSVNDQPTR